jgi:hypothetical protein
VSRLPQDAAHGGGARMGSSSALKENHAIEAYLRLRVTNARTEGYNRKIKQCKRGE